MSQPCTLKTSSTEDLIIDSIVDYLCIYCVALTLRTDGDGICHEIVDQSWITLSEAWIDDKAAVSMIVSDAPASLIL